VFTLLERPQFQSDRESKQAQLKPKILELPLPFDFIPIF
jgi:hypothetical protein